MSEKVVIIGSGLGGLSCGFILQKNGFDVTVLEQGLQVGGCLQCFTRKGVKFETGMHYIGSAAPGQSMDRMMKYLELKENVRLCPLDSSAYDTICISGDKFCFANGRDAFVESLAAHFPSEKDNLRHYVGIVDEIARASALSSLASDSRDIAINTDYQTVSVNSVLDSLFDDELLKKVLVGNLPLYAGQRDKTPFSLHAFIMDFYNRSAYRVAGGSDTIAISLKKSIERLGGKVLTGKKAIAIRCNDTKATGVETLDGCLYTADYVISAIHPKRMLELLDTKLIRPAFRTRINAIGESSSVFTLFVKFRKESVPYLNTNYYGYDGGTPWNCEEYTPSDWPKGFLYMHMCHEDNPVWAECGVVLSYMKWTDVQRWEGTAVGRRGEDYEEFKKVHSLKLIEAVDKHFPGFAASIEYSCSSTPLTYQDYTGTHEGGMYGVAKDVGHGPEWRVPYRTRIPNLLLAGQNVNSHGMMGVMVGTIITCGSLIPQDILNKQLIEV